MSPYTNPHFDVSELMAQAHALRAKVLGDAIGKGVRAIGGQLGAVFAHLKASNKRRVAVAQLLAMDERMLQDIGLNRSLVPFVVAGPVKNVAVDLYSDVGVGVTANDNGNGVRHAA